MQVLQDASAKLELHMYVGHSCCLH